MKQIGQILVERGWVDPAALARALADQAHIARRICSLLILRGELHPDNAARALSDQHSVPGVLQKHLERRDLTLAGLLPVEFARSQIALPIGRTGAGALIVCVRDPSPERKAAIAEVVAGQIVMAVAPAHQLEHLVRETYYTDAARPDAGLVLERGVATPPAALLDPGVPVAEPPAAPGPDDDEVEIDVITRQIPIIRDPLDHLESLTLVGLDDARVAKDPSQSGRMAALLPHTTNDGYPAPATGPSATASYPPSRTGTSPGLPPRPRAGSPPPAGPARGAPRMVPPRAAAPRTMSGSRGSPRAVTASHPPPPETTRPAAPVPPGFRGPALEATIAAIDGARELEAAADAAMFYLAGRFHRAVWFTIHEGAALGDRGHGDSLTPELIQSLALPLTAPSLVQIAHDTRRLADAAPGHAGAIQERLSRALGRPHTAAAIPVVVDAGVVAVIAVGDPIGDPASAIQDLDQLGESLAAACRRLGAG